MAMGRPRPLRCQQSIKAEQTRDPPSVSSCDDSSRHDNPRVNDCTDLPFDNLQEPGYASCRRPRRVIVSLTGVVTVLVAVAACLRPARRVSSVDLMIARRAQ